MGTVAVVLGIVSLVAVVGVAAKLNLGEARAMFDTLTADATDHEAQLASAESLELLHADGFTCLRCYENPALPDKIWCAVCLPVVDSYPSEPIERGAK